MKSTSIRYFFLLLFILGAAWQTIAQTTDNTFVNGDLLPNAPELAARGTYAVGVRTLTVVHKDQVDALHMKDGKHPSYDRNLTLEVWYPARVPADKPAMVTYESVFGIANNPNRPLVPFTFTGRASRDAEPDATSGAYPLVIVSHGYLGSRLLMTYLTENLASKGYVVVAIDHMESTYRDAAGFPTRC